MENVYIWNDVYIHTQIQISIVSYFFLLSYFLSLNSGSKYISVCTGNDCGLSLQKGFRVVVGGCAKIWLPLFRSLSLKLFSTKPHNENRGSFGPERLFISELPLGVGGEESLCMRLFDDLD